MMKTLLRASALALLLTATALAGPPAQAAAAPAQADSAFHATTLSLDAFGETRVRPDMATINLGVTSDAKTAAAALAANGQQMTAVMAALRTAGIAAKDIQTSNLSLNAQYVYEQNQSPRLTGYQASNQLTVTVHDLDRLGAAVDATVSAGANAVSGINLGLNDPLAAENAAREQAVRALAAKADLYARATGYRVGRLVSLSEGGGYAPSPPVPMLRAVRASAKASDTVVSAGELNVRIDVSGLYELTR
jgi:uncharacterized protein YggE